jgi:hypothetical protein
MDQLSRRAVLRLFGLSSLGMSAGCASLPYVGNKESKRTSGTLVVTNHHSLAHLVNVSVTGPTSMPKSIKSENISRKLRRVIETGLKSQISVDAGQTKVFPDFLSGSVMYTVKMWLGTVGAKIPPDADNDDNVVEDTFSPTASDTPDAHGSFLTVRIRQNGSLSWTVTYVR